MSSADGERGDIDGLSFALYCIYVPMCIATSSLSGEVCVCHLEPQCYTTKPEKVPYQQVAGHIDGLTYVHSNLTTGVV